MINSYSLGRNLTSKSLHLGNECYICTKLGKVCQHLTKPAKKESKPISVSFINKENYVPPSFKTELLVSKTLNCAETQPMRHPIPYSVSQTLTISKKHKNIEQKTFNKKACEPMHPNDLRKLIERKHKPKMLLER